MKGLIFGTGKLSNHLTRGSGMPAVARQTCDISNIDSVREQIKIYQPEVIINCAAKTNLEYCDENKTDTYNTNTLGVINLLHLCEENNIKLVHTKVWADEYLQNYGYEDYLILRPRQMISAIEHPTNMLTKFANYGTIYAHKELNSLTCVEDFIDMLEHLVSINAKGIFNCSNDGVVTPYQIALGVQAYIEPSLEVNESDYEHTLTLQPNKRVNTILCNEKLKSTGYKPRTATDALEWCLKNYNG